MTAPRTQLLNLETRKQTSPESEAVIASFFDLDGMADAITSEKFSLREEIALLVDSMRCEDAKVRLAAQKQWHTLKKDILTANGLLGTNRARETAVLDDGRTIERSASTRTLLTRIRTTQESRANVIDNENPSFTFLGPRDGPRVVPAGTPDGTPEGREEEGHALSDEPAPAPDARRAEPRGEDDLRVDGPDA